MKVDQSSAESSRGSWLALGAALLCAAILLLLAGDRIRGLLGASLQVVVGSLVVALPLGAWLALLIVKTNAPGRRAAGWMLASLLFLPLYLQAAAWDAAIGQLGWFTQASVGSGPTRPLLDDWQGVAWIHGLAAVPWVALIVGAALRSIERNYEESALLDASPARVLARVTMRHVVVGVAVAAVWVGVQVASEMTVTDLLRVRTFAEEIYTQVMLGAFQPNSDVPASISAAGMWCGISLLILLGAGALVVASGWLVREFDSNSGVGDGPWRWRLRAGRVAAGVALWLPVLLMLVTPIANLTYQAGITVDRVGDSWVRGWSITKLLAALVTSPWIHRADLLLTAKLGTAVASSALALGGVWAWAMASSRRTPWGSLVVVAGCLILPGPVLGIAAMHLLNHPWESGLSGLTWMYDNTLLAPWLVQTVRAAPIVALVLWPVFASMPADVLTAARADGVGWWGRLLRVAAPMRWRALAGAWLAALAVSVAELPATYMVLPPGQETVAKRVFLLLHSGVEDRLAGLSLAAILFFLVVAALAALITAPRASEENFLQQNPNAIK